MDPTTDAGTAPLEPRDPDHSQNPSQAGSPGLARIETLIGLLGDESPRVYSEVLRQLQRHGRAARPGLHRAVRHRDPHVRARARLFLLSLGREQAVRRLVRYALRDDVDLESGLWLLSRLEQPKLDVRPYIAQLDAMSAEVARRLENRPPGLERALVLSEYLGGELGYGAGDPEDYHHPDHIYLHRAIERRAGMPLTLGAVYLAVARRVGVRASLVPLPGHVVVRLRSGGKSALVDAYRYGVQRTERELLQYLAEHRLPFNPSWFRDADDRSMLVRQMNNLRRSYQARGLWREVRGIDLIVRTLAHRSPSGRDTRLP